MKLVSECLFTQLENIIAAPYTFQAMCYPFGPRLHDQPSGTELVLWHKDLIMPTILQANRGNIHHCIKPTVNGVGKQHFKGLGQLRFCCGSGSNTETSQKITWCQVSCTTHIQSTVRQEKNTQNGITLSNILQSWYMIPLLQYLKGLSTGLVLIYGSFQIFFLEFSHRNLQMAACSTVLAVINTVAGHQVVILSCMSIFHKGER